MIDPPDGEPVAIADPDNPKSGTAHPGESSLSAFCGHLIEACWLAAVGIVPLLLEPFAASGIPAAKMSVLNSLGIIVTGALVIRLADRPASGRPGLPAWLFAVGAVIAAFAISTFLSVDLQNSLWGGTSFLHGSVALFCQLGLFAGVATCLRTPSQIHRLVAVILAASVPLAMYLLLQRFGWDPITFGRPANEPSSFAGHPIFAAGSLLLAIPLCSWRFASSFSSARSNRSALAIAEATFFGLLFLTLVGAVLASGKRGPFLGFLGSATCAAVLFAVCRKKFRHAIGALIVAGCVVVFLLGLALFARENPWLKQLPVLERLSMIVPVGTGTGDEFRMMVWGKSPVMVVSGEPMVFPDGRTDPWWRIRPITGYGPETLQANFQKHVMIPNPSPNQTIESRLHNSLWDTLQSAGLFGLMAMLWLNVTVFARGLTALPLRPSITAPWRLLVTGLVVGSLAGVAMELQYGTGYFGLGFPMGFVGALILGPLAAVARSRDSPLPLTAMHLLAIALLSAITGHWIDMTFVFPTANTSALSWVCAGALVALGRPRRETMTPVNGAGNLSPVVGWLWAGLLRGILAGGMMAVIAHAFVSNHSLNPVTMADVLETSMMRVRYNQAPSYLIWLLLLPSWLSAIFILGRDERGREGRNWKSLIVSGITSLAILGTWSLWKSTKLAAIGPIPIPAEPMEKVYRMVHGFETLSLAFFLVTLCLTFTTALLLGRWIWRSARPRPKAVAIIASIVVSFLCGSAIWFTQIPPLFSVATSAAAFSLERFQQNAAAAEIYGRALEQNPRDHFSRIRGTEALMKIAERSTDTQECLKTMRRAESLLQAGLKVSDLNVLNYFHGNVLLRQAMEMPPGEEKTAVATRSAKAYAAAILQAPGTSVAWFEASLVERELLSNPEAADTKLIRADGLAASGNPADFGDEYAAQLKSTANPILRRHFGLRGAAFYSKAIERARESTPEYLAQVLVSKGTLLVNIHEVRLATETLLEVVKLQQTTYTWQAHAMLTELYIKQGNRPAAADHVEKAIEGAPEAFRKDLQALKFQISR